MNELLRRRYRQVLPEGRDPYDYQLDVGTRLLEGENIVLLAPTGCGKTLSALVPFIAGRKEERYSRLIYCLPLRTLVRSIYGEAKRVVGALAPEFKVAMQTGEEPGDAFFSEADIVVCTYDQLLSGLLAAPYGLSERLANVNAACITGALVVFDEFHLMATDKAFLTAAACLAQFGGLTQSLWMSATATEPLVDELQQALRPASVVTLPEQDWAAVPSVARVQRTIQWQDVPLTAEEVEKHRGRRVVVIVNQVERAQKLLSQIPNTPEWPVRLLHARFFPEDRERREEWLKDHFGKDGRSPGLLICTQVIEAGVDITSDVLLTELAPMNALVQRAGRCARFPPGEPEAPPTRGEILVFALPEDDRAYLPYEPADLEEARTILAKEAASPTRMDPERNRQWVQTAHAHADDALRATGWEIRQSEVVDRVRANALGGNFAGVSEFIRDTDDTVRVILGRTPPDNPASRAPLKLSRNRLRRMIGERDAPIGWARVLAGNEPEWQPLTPTSVRGCYLVCLHPSAARYTEAAGLEPGLPGEVESPPQPLRPRPGYGKFEEELWTAHTTAVKQECELRAARELPAASAAAAALTVRYGITYPEFLAAVRFAALFHDFAKLQAGWQAWAVAYQCNRDAGWQSRGPLAHWKHDRECAADRERERRIYKQHGKRPTHACQGAFFAVWTASEALAGIPPERQALLASAACAAITAHHGGWLPRADATDLDCQALNPDWKQVLTLLRSHGVSEGLLLRAAQDKSKRQNLRQAVDHATGSQALREHWPLVSLLTRILRLSDQKATREGGGD